MLSMCGIIKTICHPQNIYDVTVLGLNYMPPKPVAVATSAIVTGIALYVTQPDTFLDQPSIVVLSSSLSYASVEVAHRIGCKLWQKRLLELGAAFKEKEKTPESIEAKHKRGKEIDEFLDDLFEKPEFRKNCNLDTKYTQTT